MKTRVQAQHLKPGDIVGSGERIAGVVINSTQFPSNKVKVYLDSNDKLTDLLKTRSVLWSKYTMINVERKE